MRLELQPIPRQLVRQTSTLLCRPIFRASVASWLLNQMVRAPLHPSPFGPSATYLLILPELPSIPRHLVRHIQTLSYGPSSRPSPASWPIRLLTSCGVSSGLSLVSRPPDGTSVPIPFMLPDVSSIPRQLFPQALSPPIWPNSHPIVISWLLTLINPPSGQSFHPSLARWFFGPPTPSYGPVFRPSVTS